ncbi:MAG: hypothetical protein HY939_01935 [Gammaproteobacteria bacterium]|nr:hypothetical protein [Gammaproteobacteria bacterium]
MPDNSCLFSDLPDDLVMHALSSPEYWDNIENLALTNRRYAESVRNSGALWNDLYRRYFPQEYAEQDYSDKHPPTYKALMQTRARHFFTKIERPGPAGFNRFSSLPLIRYIEIPAGKTPADEVYQSNEKTILLLHLFSAAYRGDEVAFFKAKKALSQIDASLVNLNKSFVQNTAHSILQALYHGMPGTQWPAGTGQAHILNRLFNEVTPALFSQLPVPDEEKQIALEMLYAKLPEEALDRLISTHQSDTLHAKKTAWYAEYKKIEQKEQDKINEKISHHFELAAMLGCTPLVRYFLQKKREGKLAGWDPLEIDIPGPVETYNILTFAALNRDAALATTLLKEMSGEEQEKIFKSTEDKKHPIYIALLHRDIPTLAALLKNTSDALRQQLITRNYEYLINPLFFIIKYTPSLLLEAFLKSITPAQRQMLFNLNAYGLNVFHTALTLSHIEKALILLTLSSPEQCYSHFTNINLARKNNVLHTAAKIDRRGGLLENLFGFITREQYRALFDQKNEKGKTPYELALKKRSLNFAIKILELASPEQQQRFLTLTDEGGNNLLHLAAEKNRDDIIRRLFKILSPPQQENLLMQPVTRYFSNFKFTALTLAVENVASSAIDIILKLTTPHIREQLLTRVDQHGHTLLERIKYIMGPPFQQRYELFSDTRRLIEHWMEITKVQINAAESDTTPAVTAQLPHSPRLFKPTHENNDSNEGSPSPRFLRPASP